MFDFLQLAREIGSDAMRITQKGEGVAEIGDNPLGQRTIETDKFIEDTVAGALRRARVPCVLVTEEAGLIEISKKPEWTFVCDPLDGSENYKRGIQPYCLGLCYAPFGGTAKDVREAFILELSHGDEFYCAKGKGAYRNGKRVKPSGVKRMKDAIISLDFYREGERKRMDDGVKLGLLAALDMRRFGPDLLDLGYCACGGLDAYINTKNAFSAIHACGVALVSEDCVVTDQYGDAVDPKLEVEAKMNVIAAGTKELHSEILALYKR